MKQDTPLHASRGEQGIATLAFFLLFPGFFFYHTLLGIGAAGAFLGGYFAPVSLLLVGPLCVVYARQLRRNPNRLNRIDLSYWLYLAYFGTVVVANAALGANPAIVANHVLAILFAVNIFIIFKTIDFAERRFRSMGLLCMAAMSVIVFYFSVDGVFYLGAMGIARDADSLATYQGFSRSYLFTYIAVAAFTGRPGLRLLLLGVAAPALYINGARSEFAALLFLAPVIELYYARHKLVLVLLMALAVLVLYLNLDNIVAALPGNRVLELLDLSQSTSANARHHLSLHAIDTILAHPFLGDYASYPAGHYAHNVLSAWVDLGLVGIAMLLGVLVVPAVPMFCREYFRRQKDAGFILGFSFACVTLLLLITSHYFTDMLIGATLGCYSTYWYGRKYDTHRPPDVGPSAPRYPHLRQAVPQPGTARV